MTISSNKPRAPRNKTIELTSEDRTNCRARLTRLRRPVTKEAVCNRIIHQNMAKAIPFLPDGFVDLLFLDPPYNLDKKFAGRAFKKMSMEAYAAWFEEWFTPLMRLLTPTAVVYICGDWQTSSAIHQVAARYLHVRNRITWEREKGRGALTNWKNCAEDLWFCTVSDTYSFHLDAVKLKRRVVAPYTHADGQPKDWDKSDEGNFRLTHPSNLWTDLTIPYWSMPENTEHPTQKPEKLLAKVILAHTASGEWVMDPFLGSGTTAVVAKKLGRCYLGIEQDETFCCLAEKRLAMAETDTRIQGYADGVFWERNTTPFVKKEKNG